MPVIALKLIDKYDAYVGRYAYLCGNENRERIDFVSIIMAKELIRVPRVLGESYNSVLIERLYEAGGNVMLDHIPGQLSPQRLVRDFLVLRRRLLP